MKLSELFKDIPIPKDIDIKGITNNSNEVRPGYLYIAIKGTHMDGNDFIPEAIGRGAVAIVTEGEWQNTSGTVFIKVSSTKDIIWQLAKRFYGDPSTRMKVIGITGTNGKTTTSFLVRNILQKAGISTGLLGTIDYLIGDRKIPASLTTPDVLKVNQYLAQMGEAGCKVCVMEVSSHALEQGRVKGIDFGVGIYTNLGRDHLDYHRTLDNYLSSKARLFKNLNRRSWAVVNIDDPYSGSILQSTLANVIGYGIGNISSAEIGFKIKARGIRFSSSGMKFSVLATGFNVGFPIETKLIGYHNVYNILAAIGAVLTFEVSPDAIREGVYMTEEIPGRLQRIDMGQPFSVYIDYAHTPDALENVLNTLRQITKARLLLLFGCGGDRDKEKRPLMGRIASRLSDYTIITTDNPRTEEPAQIIKDIEKGFIGSNYKIIEDRREAIREAIDICQPGDVLIIAGKGHENYQILKHTVVPFSDKAVVEEVLREYAGSIC